MGKVVLDLVNDCWREVGAQPRAGEHDPSGLDAHVPGAKLDLGKAPLVRGAFKYFPRALLSIAELSKHGAEKYSWRGWESVGDGIQRYEDAMGRHIVDEMIEGEFDKKWAADGKQVLHATAVAWNALARLELILREKEEALRTCAQSMQLPVDATATQKEIK